MALTLSESTRINLSLATLVAVVPIMLGLVWTVAGYAADFEQVKLNTAKNTEAITDLVSAQQKTTWHIDQQSKQVQDVIDNAKSDAERQRKVEDALLIITNQRQR